LAEEFLSSGVWAYSTWFGETSCVTAMEAQAAGLRMVTSPIAALNETVGDRGVLIDGDWLSEGYQNKFVDSVVRAMTDPENGDRQKLQKYAKENFSWDSLAVDWIKMFGSIIKEVQEVVIPPYKGWLEPRQ
jgi:glycosyltransferase involved in cell wall biosynthesis